MRMRKKMFSRVTVWAVLMRERRRAGPQYCGTFSARQSG
jgi:hypothetical protein